VTTRHTDTGAGPRAVCSATLIARLRRAARIGGSPGQLAADGAVLNPDACGTASAVVAGATAAHPVDPHVYTMAMVQRTSGERATRRSRVTSVAPSSSASAT